VLRIECADSHGGILLPPDSTYPRHSGAWAQRAALLSTPCRAHYILAWAYWLLLFAQALISISGLPTYALLQHPVQDGTAGRFFT
jgi:hypothetical protein